MAYGRRGGRGFSFKRPNMMAVWSEIILLALWLFFGDKIITTISTLVGDVTNSTFIDAYKILGIGKVGATSNSSNGLLGIIALVMVVMILTNFISYK